MDRSLVLQQEKEIASVALTRKLQHIQGSLEIVIRVRIAKFERILTDGLLRPTVYKGLDRMPIYLNWDTATGEQRPKYVKFLHTRAWSPARNFLENIRWHAPDSPKRPPDVSPLRSSVVRRHQTDRH